MIAPDAGRPVFFDGVEGDGELVVRCACGRRMRAKLWTWLGEARAPSASESEALELVAAPGLCRWRTAHGLSPYLGGLACSACGASYRVVIGLDEVQPMRWRAALHAAWPD
ncbi:MAG: hypothetical protein EP329_15945 [Deltaproteobacteria bacterium]|nr:MAG: hypothetical protein EP329_15945 [Deltaproteobacteria bacterium]